LFDTNTYAGTLAFGPSLQA